MTDAASLIEHGQIEFGPWNPGLSAQLPSALLPLSTVFRPENALVSADEARELSGFTGLPVFDLAAFRPERMIVHELLVRLTADFTIPDGPKYEDLGVNFRAIASTILTRHLTPRTAEICGAWEAYRQEASELIDRELRAILFADTAPTEKKGGDGWIARLLGKGRKRGAGTSGDRTQRALDDWQQKASATDNETHRIAYEALARIVTAIAGKHGAMRGDSALVRTLAVNMTCNSGGSTLIGRLIAPLIRDAAAKEGFRLLPPQAHPVVMNIKGASASGKSTMRPLQRQLAEKLGIDWADFAVISPDIWRKYLLDYDSLGPAYKYAGTLTGHELAVIDRKLDGYMAEKAASGAMSHLLIDRFRFDSFAPQPDAEEGSNLLTRFGHEVYMFFMITPPEATVERAWKRGLKFGRYKAVDDLLDHNVEAFTGMPRLFFMWALRTDRTVHYEFLDNSVPEGEPPRTVAYGCNGHMAIVDVKCLIDIDRYRKINIDAHDPGAVYPVASTFAAEANTDFLRECARRIATIDFVDRDSGQPYARMEQSKMVWIDEAGLEQAFKDPETRAGILAMDADAIIHGSTASDGPVPRPVESPTLGK